MHRRAAIFCLAAALVAGPVLAGSFEDDIVGQLHRQGYAKVEVSRTLLGRVRIVASSRSRWREIVINPRTGEILRDYSELLGSATAPTIFNNSGKGSSGSNSGSGSSGGNSGSGSSGGNSGSGSSGGGDDDGDDDDDG